MMGIKELTVMSFEHPKLNTLYLDVQFSVHQMKNTAKYSIFIELPISIVLYFTLAFVRNRLQIIHTNIK